MPELLTKRLALLPYLFPEKELLKMHYRWMNDPEVLKYSEYRHRKVSWAACKHYICSFDHQQSHIWAILDKSVKSHRFNPWHDFNYMGHITARCDPYNKTAEVGILIGNQKCWKQGYGTEAWQAVCDWLIRTGARKICAGCMEPNEGMRRIFAKTGMVEDARAEAQFLFEKKPVDMIRVARFK